MIGGTPLRKVIYECIIAFASLHNFLRSKERSDTPRGTKMSASVVVAL
jgi:hypothetical protein